MDNPETFKSLAIAVGLSFCLTACGGGGGGSGSSSGDRQLFIQPIQVCDDNGVNCADIEFYEDITAKIWAQAGIDISFLTPTRLNNSTYLSIAPNPDPFFPYTNYEFYQLSFTRGTGAFGRHPDSGFNTGPINMWFVDEIESTSGIVFGTAWVGANGVLISDDTFSFNGGIGRVDTIAHEIGHNLGLGHNTFGAGGGNNLMTAGTFRNIPSSVEDVTPDGANLDQLTPSQIDEARTSSLLADSNGSSTETPIIETDPGSHPPHPALDNVDAPSPEPTSDNVDTPPPDSAPDHVASHPSHPAPDNVDAPPPEPTPDNWIAYHPPEPTPDNWIATSSKLAGPLKSSDLAKPVNIPEPLISPLIWLGLAALGLLRSGRHCHEA